jgi:hypothetical protein
MQIYSPIAQDSLVVSGSAFVSGSVTAQSFIGSFSGTASYAANALTSSYALTASVALNVPATASYAMMALTASYSNFAANTTSASFAVSAAFASQASIASSASFATNAGTAGSASFATNASTAASASHAVSASYTTASAFANNSTSASYALSASYAVASSTAISSSFATVAANASSASYALNSSNAVSASFASSASYAMSASYATASSFATTASYAVFAATATTASFATNASTAASASFATNAGTAGSASYAVSASYATASSFASSASYALNASNAVTASYALNSVTASYALFSANSTSASYALSSSYAFNSSVAVSSSYATNAGFAGSASFATQAANASSASFATNTANATSASIAQNAVTASYIRNAASASYALSSSYALNASTAASASFASNAANASSASYAQFANTASSADNFTVRGTLTAQTLVVQTITSSVSLITGSTVFGQLGTNTHQFTGSLRVSGSGNHWILGGNVGIDTTSPGAKLEIYGTGNTLRLDSGANGAKELLFRNVGTQTATIKTDGHLKLYTEDANRNIYFDTSGGTKVIILDNGNVGIGTTSPVATLHLHAAAPYIYFDDTSTSGTLSRFKLIVGDVGITQTATFGFDNTSGTANKDILVINENSNVGIGTNNPQNSLEIRKDQNAYTRVLINNNNALGGTGLSFMRGAGIYAFFEYDNTADTLKIQNQNNGNYGSLLLNSAGGSVGIGTTPTAKFHVNDSSADAFIRISKGASTIGNIDLVNEGNRFSIQDDGTRRLSIDTNGNVGIGTATPVYILHVYDGSSERFGIAGDVVVRGSTDLIIAGTSRNISFAAGTGTVRTTTANNLVLATNSTTAVTIDSSQNVGIGTTAPTSRLQVNYAGDNAAGFRLQGDSNDNTLEFRTNNNIAHIQAYTASAYTTGASLAINASGGNVGIGTSTPDAPLNIFGTTERAYLNVNAIAGFAGIGSGSGAMVYFNNRGDGNNVLIRTNNSSRNDAAPFAVWNENNSRFIILNNGNVGVGTTSPSALTHMFSSTSGLSLRIESTATNGEPSINFYGKNSSGTVRSAVIKYDNADLFRIGTPDAIPMRFETSDISRLYISSDGNVGIGTTSPVQKLDVIGKIRATDDLVMAQANPAISFDNGSAGALRFFSVSGSAERMRIQSNGYVGINTTSPGSYLDVIDEDGDQQMVRVRNYSVAATGNFTGNYAVELRSAWTDGARSGSLLVHSQEANDARKVMAVSDSNGVFTTFVNGKVGIGSTTPAHKLDIVGAVRITNTSGSGNFLRIKSTTSNWGGQVDFYESDTLSHAIISRGANNEFYIRDEYNSATRLTINNVGNVGIGTTAPGYKLEVNSNIRAFTASSGVSPRTDLGGTIIAEGSTRAGLYILTSGTAAGSYGSIWWGNGNINTDAYITVGNDTRAMDFGTADGFRMRITSGGNVGIGTTAPTQKLHVNGFARVRGVSVNETGGTVSAFIGYEKDWLGTGTSNDLAIASEGSNNIKFYTNGTAAVKIIINTSGSVGIGTTSPNTPISLVGNHVSGQSTLKIQSVTSYASSGLSSVGFNDSDGNRKALVYTTIEGLQLETSNDTPILFNTNGNTKMVLTNGGNLGIGTTAPTIFGSGGLQILGSGQRGIRISGNSTNSNSIEIGSDGSKFSYIQTAGTSDRGINFYTGNASAVVMTLTGSRVGIGTQNPLATLDVTGSDVDFIIPATSTLATAIPFTINSSGTARNMTGNAGGYSFGDNTMLSLIAGDDVQTQLALWRASDAATGTSAGSRLAGFGSRGSMASPVTVGDDDVIFSVEGWAIHGAGPNKAKFGAGMRFVKDDDFGTANTYAPQRTEFYNANSTTTIQTNMIILPNGNVGIGTTLPDYKLRVQGTSFFSSTMGIDGEGNGLTVDTGYGNNGRVGLMKYGGFEGMLVAGNSTVLRLGHRTDSDSVASGGTPTIRVDLFIAANGSVGISTTSPSYALDVTGTIRATGDVIAYSDARVKDNVKTIEAPLDLVTKLRGVTYTRNDSEDKSEKVGVIAQEVLEILPQVVSQDDNGNYSVAYGNMVGVLIEAIKELKAEIDELKNNKK